MNRINSRYALSSIRCSLLLPCRCYKDRHPLQSDPPVRFLGSIGITMMISVPSPIRIQCVQTDNGSEFTHRLRSEKKTLFEEALRANGIDHHPIRPAMPRHNGKVERSHREDQKRFYDKTTFCFLQDAYAQRRKYLKKSNDRPMRPLDYSSFNDMISILLNA